MSDLHENNMVYNELQKDATNSHVHKHMRDRKGDQRGWMGADKNFSQFESSAYDPLIHTQP